MAWERSFEARVMKIRAKELKYQRLNYIIEVSSPFLLVSSLAFTTVCRPCSTAYGSSFLLTLAQRALPTLMQECVASCGHSRLVLALHGSPWADAHAFHCFSGGEPFSNDVHLYCAP